MARANKDLKSLELLSSRAIAQRLKSAILGLRKDGRIRELRMAEQEVKALEQSIQAAEVTAAAAERVLLVEQPHARKSWAGYAARNFERFFGCFHKLLGSEYVTQRLTLRLLSDLLVDRAYLDVMLVYIKRTDFLKLHMDLLRNTSNAIRLDAFHIFKVFAGNPRPVPGICRILFQNKEKLIALISTALKDEDDDGDLRDDKDAVLSVLCKLSPQFLDQLDRADKTRSARASERAPLLCA